MEDSRYATGSKRTIKDRIYVFLEEIWPSVYKIINALFFGIITFIKYLFTGLFPKR